MRSLLLFAVLSATGLAAHAQERISREEARALGQIDPDMREQVESLIDEGVSKPDSTMQEQAQRITEESRNRLLDDNGAPAWARTESDTADDRARVVLYVSTAMPDTEIKTAIEALSRLDGISGEVIYRGILEGETLTDFAARARAVTPESIEDVAIQIDPTRFAEQSLKAVPRLVYRDDTGERIAWVDGLSNPHWLVEAVRGGERGDLGQRGPVLNIPEESLIAMMKRRFLALDLEAEKERTIRTYWDRADLNTLPVAREDRVRRIDPSIVIPRDMRDGEGNLIHAAGKRINPLEIREFTRRLIIIDPTRQSEREWLDALPSVDGKRDVLMITDIDREAGWAGFESIGERFERRPYLLTDDVQQRFGIQATPTLVTASDERFVVREFAVSRAAGSNGDSAQAPLIERPTSKE
jgi:conjugal transfer pilus assembly protein TraW